jgi:hypothetical protein
MACRLKDTRLVIRIWSEAEFKDKTGASRAPSRRSRQAVRLRLPRLLKSKPSLPPIVAADLRMLGPVHACTCGCTVFVIFAQFDNYDISWWGLDAECSNCGNLVKVPCPVDNPDNV